MRDYRSAVSDNRRWQAFNHRPGDIFVCTPPKCGTTWMQTIIASLLWPAGDAPGPVMTIAPWFDARFEPVDVVTARLEAQGHRRFVKTHTPADGIPWFDTGQYVFVGRDGRDAFMSMCHHVEVFDPALRAGMNETAAREGLPAMVEWTGDVHEFLGRWLDSGWLEHVASFWARRAAPNLLFVHYNDLKADLADSMRRVAEFLAIDVPAEAWPTVVARCTFDAMRARGDEIGTFVPFEGGAKAFLYKGSNGRWRDVLTPDELVAYSERAAAVLPPEALAWLEHGGRAPRE